MVAVFAPDRTRAFSSARIAPGVPSSRERIPLTRGHIVLRLAHWSLGAGDRGAGAAGAMADLRGAGTTTA
ncbi:hypothetical protein GCM10010252_32030 [Streptomyces aureoverticillatus]|nr:hypothetical protein GCM10010252_32030 [Streptomyces aureoverticillatus]